MYKHWELKLRIRLTYFDVINTGLSDSQSLICNKRTFFTLLWMQIKANQSKTTHKRRKIVSNNQGLNRL